MAVAKEVDKKGDFVKWFSELNNKDISIAGGKGASLSEMYNHNFPIPPGFMVSAQAYAYFIEKSGVREKMNEILNGLDVEDTKKLEDGAAKIREMISNAEMPKEMESEILEAYSILDTRKLGIAQAKEGAMQILRNSHEPPFVAVRSSATAEDLADASFAGQQDSFLNVKGNREIIKKIKECFASLFTARAVYYRTKKKFDHNKVSLAVVIQKMIDSEKSGVMFSVNPVKNNNCIVIEAVWGLGEGIVSGKIKPDHYEINRNLDLFKVEQNLVANKKIAIVRTSSGNNDIVKLSDEKSERQVLSNYELKRLSQYALQLEKHYGKPQDIEFAIEGSDLFIVQSRPITTEVKEAGEELDGEVLLNGLGASPGISSGEVKIIRDLNELDKVKEGDVLVTEMTSPDMVVSMQKASAIITDEGGLTSHASIVSREMGIPAVVGTGNATGTLMEGEIVTVDGNRGKVYRGKTETKKAEIKPVIPTRTKIKVIVDLPDYAERAALSGCKAVGLVRLEGIIAGLGKHPIYYVKNKETDQYISSLVKGLTKISEHFEEVWVRSSDIRTDEYKHLQGALNIEGNPMLGDHGIRFTLKHKEILKAELTAIKELADSYHDKKFGFMIPQVINVNELKETKKMADEIVMPANVKIGIMVETPAAVQIINDLCQEGMDFISFGTNDLTQYTLALDRNNENVQDLYNEMNPAVLNSIAYVLRRCKKYKIETSICGQAGSKEEMARFLVENGITSISVNADAAHNVSKIVAEIESKMKDVLTIDIQPDYEAVRQTQNSSDSDSMPVVKAHEGDIENVILHELESNEYNPGSEIKDDVPVLNESIPIESEMAEETRAEDLV